MSKSQQISIVNSALPDSVPPQVQIVPWGQFKSHRTGGGQIETLVDEQAFEMVQAAFSKQFAEPGVDMVFDFEHQSLGGSYAAPDGLSRAAGWVKSLRAVPGEGIFADVEWTPRAREMIANKEYRYPSIVGNVRASDNRITEISSVALTNQPAAPVNPIANSNGGKADHNEETNPMDKILAALGLEDGADEAAILEAIEKQQTELKKLKEEKEAKATEEGEDKKGEEEDAKAANSRKSSGDVVPSEEFTVVKNSLEKATKELEEVQEKLATQEAEVRIANAIDAGKITPADMKDEKAGGYYRKTARDPEAWNACVERLPVKGPVAGKRIANARTTTPTPNGDTIIANSGRFDQNRMGDYKRAREYADKNKVSMAEAASACGV